MRRSCLMLGKQRVELRLAILLAKLASMHTIYHKYTVHTRCARALHIMMQRIADMRHFVNGHVQLADAGIKVLAIRLSKIDDVAAKLFVACSECALME